jgi:hypothetical protein
LAPYREPLRSAILTAIEQRFAGLGLMERRPAEKDGTG